MTTRSASPHVRFDILDDDAGHGPGHIEPTESTLRKESDVNKVTALAEVGVNKNSNILQTTPDALALALENLHIYSPVKENFKVLPPHRVRGLKPRPQIEPETFISLDGQVEVDGNHEKLRDSGTSSTAVSTRGEFTFDHHYRRCHISFP
jgi:hypothetical protein